MPSTILQQHSMDDIDTPMDRFSQSMRSQKELSFD